MYKAHQVRTTFGSCDVDKVHAVVSRSTFRSQNAHRTTFGRWDVEKVHAVVSRSTFRSQNVQNTPGVRTTFGRWDVEKVHAVVARSTFASEKSHVRTAFGSLAVEKVHAVVARSTFRSQNVKSTSGSDHFWKLICRKSACRFGAKHISKSKCTRHTILGRLLEVEMSKKCTPSCREEHFEAKMYKTHQGFGPLLEGEMSKKCTLLWREAHFEVKMLKAPVVLTTFGSWDVEKVHSVLARSTFRSENVKNTRGSDHFWTFRCRFAWQVQGIVDLVKSEQNMPKRSG